MMEQHPTIGDVRGAGLLLAIELVTDRESRAPFSSLAEFVFYR